MNKKSWSTIRVGVVVVWEYNDIFWWRCGGDSIGRWRSIMMKQATADLSEVERVVTGFPVARVAAVGPADHRVETVVRVGGVLDQPHGTVWV